MKNIFDYFYKKKFFYIFLLVLLTIQILNLKNFNIHGYPLSFNDLKWSGSNLFLQNKNVYEIFYSGNYENQIIKSQFPNYLVSSLYFHLPFGYFNFKTAGFIWTSFTFLLLIHSYLIYEKNNLMIKNQDKVIFFSFILLMLSKPFNSLISNGNYSIVCFWAVNYFFLSQHKNKFIALFVTFIKYSFAPILIFYSLLNKDFKTILLVLLLNIILMLHFSYIFNYNFIQLIFDPLIIGSKSTASGFFDLQTLLGNHPSNVLLRYSIIIFISFIIYFCIYNLTLRNSLFDLCVVVLVTLLFYKHLYYDQILLLPVLIYSFKLPRKFRIITISIIFYYWFIAYLEVLHSIRYWKIFMLFNNSLGVICIYLLFKVNKLSKKIIFNDN